MVKRLVFGFYRWKCCLPFAFLKIANATGSNDLMTCTYTHAHASRSQSSGELGIHMCHGLESTAIANLRKGECGPKKRLGHEDSHPTEKRT